MYHYSSLRIIFIELMMIGSMILFLFATESIVAFTPITKQIRSTSFIVASKRTTATTRQIKSSTPFSLQATTAGSDKKKKERKDSYTITLLPGDGIGPEITKSVRVVLDALCKKCNFALELKEALIGGAAIDAVNNPFPIETYEQCIKSDSILLACIGGYKWDSNPRELRPETGLLAMRKQLNLYANLRPAKVLKQLIDSSTLKPEIIDNVDIMVVRELTGDVYFGTPKGIDVIDGQRVGYNNMIYMESEIDRIARVAGEVASKRTNKLCSVDKANVLDVSQLWRDVVTDVITTDYPNIALSHMYVDNAAMQLIRNPKQFDTIVCGNIFGDILSDEASMLVGSLGMLPSASIGDSDGPGVFEPCHGSAPDIAGMDIANPLAMILSAAMMLTYDLERPNEALLLETAVEMVLDLGLRTADIKQENDNCQLVGCIEMGNAVANIISSMILNNDNTMTAVEEKTKVTTP